MAADQAAANAAARSGAVANCPADAVGPDEISVAEGTDSAGRSCSRPSKGCAGEAAENRRLDLPGRPHLAGSGRFLTNRSCGRPPYLEARVRSSQEDRRRNPCPGWARSVAEVAGVLLNNQLDQGRPPPRLCASAQVSALVSRIRRRLDPEVLRHARSGPSQGVDGFLGQSG